MSLLLLCVLPLPSSLPLCSARSAEQRGREEEESDSPPSTYSCCMCSSLFLPLCSARRAEQRGKKREYLTYVTCHATCPVSLFLYSALHSVQSRAEEERGYLTDDTCVLCACASSTLTHSARSAEWVRWKRRSTSLPPPLLYSLVLHSLPQTSLHALRSSAWGGGLGEGCATQSSKVQPVSFPHCTLGVQ